jgi:hypothetical protein
MRIFEELFLILGERGLKMSGAILGPIGDY